MSLLAWLLAVFAVSSWLFGSRLRLMIVRSKQRTLGACLAILGLLLCATQVASGAAADPTAAILAQARAAAGGNAFDAATGLHLKGRLTIAGIRGTFDQWVDARKLGYREDDNAGPLTGSQGFDGQQAWDRDWGDVRWIDGGKAGRYGAIALAYLASNSFLRPDQREQVSYVGRRHAGGLDYDVLRATPPGGLPLEIWLDAKTHLVARTITRIGIQTSITVYDDYRTVSGISLPFHVHSSSSSGNESDAVVTTAQLNPSTLVQHLVMPVSQPHDYSIAGSNETSLPIDIIDNHVYLNVMLNGKGPFRFAFDTGGSNLLDSGVARTIGLLTSGSLQGSGVGNTSEGFSFAKIAKVGLNRATVAQQYFAVLPIRQGFSVALGMPVDGLIGFEVLARYVTTFDYAGRKVVFRLPGAAVAKAPHVDAIPFVFNSTIPQIHCKVDTVIGDCSVDTGSRASISILTPFSAAHPELVPSQASAVGINGFGVGGAALGRLGRLGSLQVGSTVLRNVIADFSAQKRGYFANPFIAGNIGGGVWRRFTVTFDYPRTRMTLVPNKNFSEPDSYDRSGLFLIAPGGQPTILDVRPKTPAAAVGLQRGDALVSIDGKNASGMTLLQIRSILRGPVGTKVQCEVRNKAGVTRTVQFALRDYV